MAPGYGMAVAQAQHQVRELAHLVEKNGGTEAMNTAPFPQLQAFLVVARLRSFTNARDGPLQWATHGG